MNRTNQRFRMTIALAFACGALVVAYYYMIYLRRANAESLISDYRARLTAEIGLNLCMEKTKRNHDHERDQYCHILGKQNECILPIYYKLKLEEKLQTTRDQCYKNFEEKTD